MAGLEAQAMYLPGEFQRQVYGEVLGEVDGDYEGSGQGTRARVRDTCLASCTGWVGL